MATESTYVQRDAHGFAKVTQAAETSIVATSVNFSTSATVLPSAALSNRRRLYIKKIDTETFTIGDSGVTTSSGYSVRQYEEVVIDLAAVSVYAIAAASATAKVLEIA
jgi:hypothetical protein